MTLRDAIDRLFGEGFLGRTLFPGRIRSLGEEQRVPVNIFELPEGLMVIVPMPGLQANDVEISVSGNVLTVRGRRTPGQEDRDYLLKEWDYGPYGRTIELPFPVDTNHIIATLDNGVLTVNLRKAASAIPKRIHVRSAEERNLTGGETHSSPQGLAREKASQGH
jgi:HSP20 family protein